MISGREAYGAYTTFATETAILAITVAKELKKVNYFKIIVYLCARNHYFSDYEECPFIVYCHLPGSRNCCG